MKPLVVLTSIAIVGIMVSLLFMYVKHTSTVKIFETVSKLDTTHQTMKLEIDEQMADIAVMKDELEIATKRAADLAKVLENIQISNTQNENQLETCQGEEEQRNDEMADLEYQRKNAEEQFEKEKVAWTSEIAALKKQLGGMSNVCKFVNTTAPEAKKLCGNVQPAVIPK